jgi:polyketide biosynthesis enoyl-CoA hydratase PksI
MSADVVLLETVEPGIARIVMQDRVHRNGFSPALIDGLVRAFEAVGTDEEVRAVILTGYDSYFASGGTRDALLKLHDGAGRFTDRPLYDLPLRCPVPVIAAMQGHGIGGGFVMGLFADFVLLSRESIYTTNFMKYGFTPGFGATCIVKERLGSALANEMLITARNYRGEELARRGAPYPALPRAEVAEAALSLARDVADKPRVSLVTLKHRLTEELRAALPKATAAEVEMHAKTFNLPEVRQRIASLFDA